MKSHIGSSPLIIACLLLYSGKTYSHQPSPYFNREFPVLGGGNCGDRPPEEKEHSYGPAPYARNTRESSVLVCPMEMEMAR